jgi:hypothetical protein
MINSNSELKILSTKLLFILCKENGRSFKIEFFISNHTGIFIANRLIKYTGFSNANQLLYDLGLVDLQDNSNKDQYSSDSDAFDTENDRIVDDEYE